MDGVFFLFSLIIAFVVFAGALKLASILERILQPFSLLVTRFANFMLRPFDYLCNLAIRGIKYLSARIFKPRPTVLRAFGGMSMVIRMGVFTLFSIFTVIFIAAQSGGEDHLLEENVMYELTPFAVFQLFEDEEGGSAAMFAPILFSLASVAFMKSTDGLHVVIRLVYDFIFNCFFFCLLFWLPQEVYTVLFGEGSSAIFHLEEYLGVFGSVLQVIAWIALIYLAIILSMLSLREVFAVLAFSLTPLVAMVGVFTILPLISMPKWLYTVLAGLVILLLSVWQCYRRVQTEEDAMKEYENKKKLKKQN